MIKEDWKDLMDYVFELDEEVAVVIGCSDIVHKEGYSSLYFKDLTVDSFWKVIGRGDNELILRDALEHWECDVQQEGEYEFKAILKYYKGDYSVGESGYWEIQHIEYKFIQTFLERERETKLNEILDFDNLFQ
jgi:hypothetical protein